MTCRDPPSETQVPVRKRSGSNSAEGEGEPDLVELAAMIAKRQKKIQVVKKKENRISMCNSV